MCSSRVPDHGDTVVATNRSLEEWLAWQERLHFTAIELGLGRCSQVAERMHLAAPDFSIISISGTNGKGSSATLLERIYVQSGYRTGCYTSPHLVRYNERIRINGVEVSDDLLCESFTRIDRERGDISLTYFEFGTLAALDIFQRANVELAILEVGLGGRLDAVNLVDADVALVCTIDLDHEQWLGPDRNTIGYEKAGIFRKNRPAICADPEPPQSITDYAAETGASLYLAGRDFNYSMTGATWSWESASENLTGLPGFIPGNSCLIRNSSGVLMVLKALAGVFPVAEGVIHAVIKNFRLPGRLQIVPGEIEYVLDVAHNRQAVLQLAENLTRLPPVTRTRMVIGMLDDKNHDQFLEILSKYGDFWYVVNPGGDRGFPAGRLTDKLCRYVDAACVKTFNDINMAFETLQRDAVAGERVIVTGSFLTVTAALKQLHIES
jgi:dihydrofolate synthase/folylpolyglutamate synthase